MMTDIDINIDISVDTDIDIDALAVEVEAEGKEKQTPLTLFMLGGVDAGKTYLATSIANRLYNRGLKVAVVDADVGQSDIGPPCCIGLGILHAEIKKLMEVPLYGIYFVGNTSPQGCRRECANGVAMAVEKAKELLTDVIVVDPTGWVEGEEAKRFKLEEISQINPSFVLAIQKQNENVSDLDHILGHLNKNNHNSSTSTNTKVIPLRMSERVRRRTKEERKALREDAYNRYFKTGENKLFDFSSFERIPEDGTILGLFDGKDKECRGMGVLEKFDRGKAVVFTPVDVEIGVIVWIKPGSVKLSRVNGRWKENFFA